MMSGKEYIEFLTDNHQVDDYGYNVKDFGYQVSDCVNNIKVQREILEGVSCRTGIKQIPKFIVIHETSIGTEKAPFNKDIEHYKNILLSSDSQVGYHYICSDKEVLQFIPDDEVAYHVGSKINFRSIGIERIVNESVNFPDALHNQANLCATLMYKWRIPLRRVVSHKNARIMALAPSKECPARMLDFQYGGEDLFKREIINCLRMGDLFNELLNDEIIDNKKLR